MTIEEIIDFMDKNKIPVFLQSKIADKILEYGVDRYNLGYEEAIQEN